MGGTIYINLCEDIFPRVKSTSELRTRLRDELTDHIIATDSDLKQFQTYFRDFIAEFRNETAAFGMMKDLDGEFTLQMTKRNDDGGLREIKALLERLCAESLLYRWYDDLGLGELAQNAWLKYEALLQEWKHNKTNGSMVTPKYRPYF